MSITLIWFRSSDVPAAIAYTRGLFLLAGDFDWKAILDSGVVQALAFYGLLSLLIDFPCWLRDRETPFIGAHPWILRGLGYAAALFILAFVREGTSDAFIYFQF